MSENGGFGYQVLLLDNPDFDDWYSEFVLLKNYSCHWRLEAQRLREQVANLKQVNNALIMKGGRLALAYERKFAQYVDERSLERNQLASELKRARARNRELSLTLAQKNVLDQRSTVLSSGLQ